ncbi:MAG: hypothetical protein WBB73_14535 [Candidatus Aminicenantaceae bacterium]
MKEYFYIEGHKSKTDYSDEETLMLEDSHAYASEERALTKAKEYFDEKNELTLVVIYKAVKLGDKYGHKYLFRNQDGILEEVDNWWSDHSCG